MFCESLRCFKAASQRHKNISHFLRILKFSSFRERIRETRERDVERDGERERGRQSKFVKHLPHACLCKNAPRRRPVIMVQFFHASLSLFLSLSSLSFLPLSLSLSLFLLLLSLVYLGVNVGEVSPSIVHQFQLNCVAKNA